MDDIIIGFVVERQKLLGHGEPMADTIRSLRGDRGTMPPDMV